MEYPRNPKRKHNQQMIEQPKRMIYVGLGDRNSAMDLKWLMPEHGQGTTSRDSSQDQQYLVPRAIGSRVEQPSRLKKQPNERQPKRILSRREETSNFPSPLDSSWVRVQDAGQPRFPDFTGCPDWAKPVMFAWHQGGFSEGLLCRIFGNLTESLLVAIRGAVYSTMIMDKFNLLKAKRSRLNLIRQALASLTQAEFQGITIRPWLQAHTSIDHFELGVFERAMEGVCRETFEPFTFRRTEYYANPRLCDMAGLSQEEYLLGVRHSDLSSHMSELDLLCLMVEDLLHFSETRSISFVRWAWPGRPAALMERRVERLFDGQGYHWQRITHFRPLSPSEYDASTNPSCATLTGKRFPSLQQAIGDSRSGSQLLGDAVRDRDEQTLSRLADGTAGRAMLSRLADEVLRRFDDTTRAARRILAECPEVEAWARRWIAHPWPPPTEH